MRVCVCAPCECIELSEWSTWMTSIVTLVIPLHSACKPYIDAFTQGNGKIQFSCIQRCKSISKTVTTTTATNSQAIHRTHTYALYCSTNSALACEMSSISLCKLVCRKHVAHANTTGTQLTHLKIKHGWWINKSTRTIAYFWAIFQFNSHSRRWNFTNILCASKNISTIKLYFRANRKVLSNFFGTKFGILSN